MELIKMPLTSENFINDDSAFFSLKVTLSAEAKFQKLKLFVDYLLEAPGFIKRNPVGACLVSPFEYGLQSFKDD